MSFVTRAYNQFETDKSNPAILVKKSLEKRLGDEIAYYEHLPEEISIHFPRLIHGSRVDSQYRLALEYYAYDNLGKSMTLSDEFDEAFWKKTFDYIFFFLRDCQRFSPVSWNTKSVEEDCLAMYIDKTEREYDALLNGFEFFKNLRVYDHLVLNGKKLRTFEQIWPMIKDYIMYECTNADFTLIHGDCCFSNILCGKNETSGDVILKFIDPRGSFGKTLFYGDIYYDLAKISHSCHGGYEYFITDKFELDIEANNFCLSYDGGSKEQIDLMFLDYVKKHYFDIRKIKILEGTIFIGMCARHYDSLERQKAMYITGLKILNEIYEEILL